MTKKTGLQQTYRLLATEASDGYTNEWIGKVSLLPQEDGEIYLSINVSSEANIVAPARQSVINGFELFIDSI
jgi:hypothetical protein